MQMQFETDLIRIYFKKRAWGRGEYKNKWRKLWLIAYWMNSNGTFDEFAIDCSRHFCFLLSLSLSLCFRLHISGMPLRRLSFFVVHSRLFSFPSEFRNASKHVIGFGMLAIVMRVWIWLMVACKRVSKPNEH